jgi:bifunctional non-homologous end joining protein LigD
MMTEDHPYDYAAFEGVSPEGNYGAGNVIIWDQGTWEFIEPGDDPVAALKSGKLTFRLRGRKMFGEWALVRIRGKGSAERGNEWLLLKHRDEFANEKIDVTKVAPRSVVSERLVEELGEDDETWQSNRKASSRKVSTIADRITQPRKAAKEKAAALASAKRARPAAKKAGKPKPASRPAAKSTAKKPGVAKKAAKRPVRGGSSRAASSRTRSSRA